MNYITKLILYGKNKNKTMRNEGVEKDERRDNRKRRNGRGRGFKKETGRVELSGGGGFFFFHNP